MIFMKDKDMEAKQNPHLKKVLKSYQLTAANTMSGPGPNSIVSRADSGFHRHNSFEGTTISSAKIYTNNLNLNPTKHYMGNSNKHNVPLLIRSVSSGTGGHSLSAADNHTLGNALIVKRENLESIKTSSGHQMCRSMGIPARVTPLPPPPPPPILSEPDRSGSEKRKTLLEGNLLSCFSVGGEERLCFPEVITVLRNASNGTMDLLPQINQVCDELQIYCSLSSSEQLEVLKRTNVIPMAASSCGLIRKTDAERLVNSFLHQNPPKAAMALNMKMTSPTARVSSSVSVISKFHLGKPNGQSESHFRVYHECFGTAEGIIRPNLYQKPDALCIECLDCHGLLSPTRFVSHAHHPQENRTCHWGFDSANWRDYLLLAEDLEDDDHSLRALRDFKAKFQTQKRKENVVLFPKEEIQDQVVIKRIRYSEALSPSFLSTSPTGLSEPLFLLPSKKRLTFTQQPIDVEKNGLIDADMDAVKKLVIDGMDKPGADIVNAVIDSLVMKISSLQTNCVCQTHGKVLKEPPEPKILMQREFHPKPSVEIHGNAKVHAVEAEIGSLKKQLLRRHEQLEEI